MRFPLLVMICSLSACVGARRPSEEILWAGRADTVLTYTSSVFVTERSRLLFGYFPDPDDAAENPRRRPTFVGVLTDRRAGTGRLLPKPEGRNFEFIRPQGMIDQKGTVHVVWAERFTDADSAPSGTRIRSLWAAHLEGRGWSHPERIGVADEFYWAGGMESQVVMTADGSFHLAVAGYVRNTPGILYNFALRNGVWSLTPLRLPQPVGYATLAATDSSLSLGYISPAPLEDRQGDSRDHNSVWYVSSSNSGRSWSKPVLVSKSGDNAATRPRVTRDARGVVHLIWAQDFNGDVYPEALRHVQSSDDGRTWSRPVDLPMRGLYPNLLDAAIDARGLLYAVYVANMDSVRVTTFARGVWTPPRDLRSDFDYFDGGFMTCDPGGDLGLVWTGLRRTAPDVVQVAWLRSPLAVGAR